MNIDYFLSRFQGVKSTGKNRWVCKCSAHQDRLPSMAVSIDNDRILINCFAGCGVYEILTAAGLDWPDIMPEKDGNETNKPKKQIIYATEALELIRFESQIIMACAIAMKNKTLTPRDLSRAEQAMQTINKCYEATK